MPSEAMTLVDALPDLSSVGDVAPGRTRLQRSTLVILANCRPNQTISRVTARATTLYSHQMRLVRADFVGYRRLVDTSINLDAPIVSIVGPNEAGRTSQLKALVHLSNKAPFASGELARTKSLGGNDVVVRAR